MFDAKVLLIALLHVNSHDLVRVFTVPGVMMVMTLLTLCSSC